MRFFPPSSSACSVALALLMLGAGAQAQGLKSPGSSAAKGSEAAISRALDATAQTSGRRLPESAAAGLRSADYIVAVVNSEPITNNEVRTRMARVAQNMSEQGGQLPPASELGRYVLERLIVERVQLQEAKDTGIKIDDATVDQAVANVARQNDISVQALLRQLQAEGLSERQFRNEIRNQMTMQRVRERDVDMRVKVTEADIDRFLKEQQRPGEATGPMVDLGHILITVPEGASAAVVAEREAKAQQAAEAARKNADFLAAVREFSDVPNGQGGGSMGMRPMNEYPELFGQQVGAAATGSVVGPFRSGAGFHVLKVLGKTQAGAPVFITQSHARHILLTLGADMNEMQAIERLRDYKRRVQAGQARFEDLAAEFSKDGSARSGGDLGWSSPGQFVPEFERALNELQPGQISEPVVSRFGVHLIQLIERRQEKLTEREQREMVRNVVRERKAAQNYETWLQELRSRAYVEFRESPQ